MLALPYHRSPFLACALPSPRASSLICALLTLSLGALISAPAFDPANGDFARDDPDHIRVLNYNVLGNFVTDAGLTSGEFTRLLQAIDPDVIAFQEINSTLTASAISTELSSILGGSWNVHPGIATPPIKNALCSRYGLSLAVTDTVPASATRGVTAALIDLPGGTYGSTDLYVMNVHMKASQSTTDYELRQDTADAIINWMRDARTAGENIDLVFGTPMIVTGDTNLNFSDRGEESPNRADKTLIDGDILQNGIYGADSPPDWDGSDAGDAAPYNHVDGNVHTFLGSGSRYDRQIYTDSVIHAVNRFTLNPGTMSAPALATAGLASTDAANASDHLPVAVDYALGPNPNAPGQLLINEWSYNDVGGDDRSFVEFINVGDQEIVLDAPVDYHFLRSDSNLPTSPPGAETQAFFYDLQGVVPPGGLFVLYDSTSESAAIATTIESALPSPLQRNDRSDFTLVNSTNIGLALVTRTPTDNGAADFDHALVEAYLYDDNTADGNHFFRTSSGNGLTITLGPDQRESSGLLSDTLSHSRNLGATELNMYPNNWTLFDTATPGTPNSTPAPVELSVFQAR